MVRILFLLFGGPKPRTFPGFNRHTRGAGNLGDRGPSVAWADEQVWYATFRGDYEDIRLLDRPEILLC